MFQKEGTDIRLIGLDLNHLNRFQVSETLGMLGLFASFGVKPEILKNVGKAITTLPDNFKPHRVVKKIFEQRAQLIETGEGIDWAVGKALAFATLLVEGNHVRLSGQDVERGTFSHRHSDHEGEVLSSGSCSREPK